LFVLLVAFDEVDIEVMHDILGTADTQAAEARGADKADAQTASAPAPVLAGLNCRDLATLQIVPKRLIELAHLLPTHVPRVAESGVVSAQDAARVAGAGYEFALVGSALMQGGDPHTLAAAMLKAGRESARGNVGRGGAGCDGVRGDAGRGDVSRDGAGHDVGRDEARCGEAGGDK
jgi:hypothetical protein